MTNQVWRSTIGTMLLVGALVSGGPLWCQTREEVLLWDTVEKSQNPDDYRAYLDKYPNGTFAPLANRRLATLLEAKRAASGSEWQGRRWFTRRRPDSGNFKWAKPDDPTAQFWTLAIKLNPIGTCMLNNTVRCTWGRTGNAVTITVAKGKDICETTFELEMADNGTQMTGSAYMTETGSCWGGQQFVQVNLAGAAAPAARPAATAPVKPAGPPRIGQLFNKEPLNASELAIGRIILGSVVRGFDNPANVPAGAYIVSNTVAAMPSDSRTFLQANELGIFFYIYGARKNGGKPNVHVEYNLYQKAAEGEKFFARTNPLVLNFEVPQDRNWLFAGLVNVPLVAYRGEYRLEIKATDHIAGATIIRNEHLTVN